MEYFAHSPKDGYPAQTYAQHINGVSERARRHASDAARYSLDDGALLLTTAEVAAVYHDLGKLDGENQSVLSGQRAAKRLPLNHTDAGAAFLLDDVSPPPFLLLFLSRRTILDFRILARRASARSPRSAMMK